MISDKFFERMRARLKPRTCDCGETPCFVFTYIKKVLFYRLECINFTCGHKTTSFYRTKLKAIQAWNEGKG